MKRDWWSRLHALKDLLLLRVELGLREDACVEQPLQLGQFLHAFVRRGLGGCGIRSSRRLLRLGLLGCRALIGTCFRRSGARLAGGVRNPAHHCCTRYWTPPSKHQMPPISNHVFEGRARTQELRARPPWQLLASPAKRRLFGRRCQRRRATRRDVRRATLRPPNISLLQSLVVPSVSGGDRSRLQVVLLRLFGRKEPDLDKVERADEPVADPEAARTHDRIAQRNRPVVLDQDQRGG